MALVAGALAQPAPPDALARCVELVEAAPAERDSSRCFRELVRSTHPELRGAAIARLDAVLERLPSEPWPAYYIASLEWSQRSERVPDLYARAADELARRGDLSGEVDARAARVRYLDLVGRRDEAEQELERLQRAALHAGETSALIRHALEDASHRVLYGGDLERALERLMRYETLALDDHALPLETRRLWLHGVATLFYELGRFGEADRALSQLERLARESGSLADEGSTALRRAMLLAAAELPSPALADRVRTLAEKAAELSRRSGSVANEAQARRILGQLLPGESGRRELERCAELAAELAGGAAIEALCLEALAVSAAAEGATRSEVERKLEAARGASVRAGDPWSRLYVLQAEARTRWLQGDREAGLELGLAVLEEVDRMRTEQIAPRGRASWLDVWWEPYHRLAGNLLGERGGTPARADLERAFEVVERMRARTLLEALGAARLAAPDETARETDEAPTLVGGHATLAAVEARLRDDEAMLSFHFSLWHDLYRRPAGGSWAIVSTRDGSRAVALPDRIEVEPVLARQLGLDHPLATTHNLIALHRQLVEPVLPHLPAYVRRLIVVPDGALHRVPFALLRPGAADESSLLMRYELSFVPSAGLWLRFRDSRRLAAPIPALVLADPTIDGAAAASREDVERVAALGRLPHARDEGRAIVRRLGRGSRLWTGDGASERLLKAHPALARHSLLHFATHALVDRRRQEHSALILAPGGTGEDGWLRADEIVGLELPGLLVVLGACDAGDGPLLRGEGAMSLARAFFLAGAPTVVASRRPLPDRESSHLFDVFYRELAAGRSVGEALTAAQRARLLAGGDARGWGALAVFGDGSMAPFPGGLPSAQRRPVLRAVIAGALLLLTVVALAWWLRRGAARRVSAAQ